VSEQQHDQASRWAHVSETYIYDLSFFFPSCMSRRRPTLRRFLIRSALGDGLLVAISGRLERGRQLPSNDQVLGAIAGALRGSRGPWIDRSAPPEEGAT
jgi:hypothetical protein